MKRKVLSGVVLALAAACAGPIVSGEATLPDSTPAPPSGIRPRPNPDPPAADATLLQDEAPGQPARPVTVESSREAPLDLVALKARLRDTDAIGMFTKIALKNQVDDLLQEFRAHHIDGRSGAIAALRQPYDLLVFKVLALIQDSDPPLASSIAASREAILGDPRGSRQIQIGHLTDGDDS